MVWVGKCHQKWIVKNRLRFPKTDFVLFDISFSFFLIPFIRLVPLHTILSVVKGITKENMFLIAA